MQRVRLAVPRLTIFALLACGVSAVSCSKSEDAGGTGGSGGNAGGGGAAEPECVLDDPAAEGTSYLQRISNGSRLKTRVLSADGMPDVFLGFFDADLNVACDFLPASDGTLRCLPRTVLPEGRHGFVDDACTQPFYLVSPACASGGYLREADECGDSYEVRQLLPLQTTTQLFMDAGGCTADASAPVEPAENTFFAGEPADPSDFVAGTLSRLPGSCRAEVQFVQAEDGAEGPWKVRDAGFEMDCGRFASTDGSSFCAPVQTAFISSNLHLNDACDDPVNFGVWNKPAGCTLPPLLEAHEAEFDYYRVGGLYEGPAFYGQSCTPARDEPWIENLIEAGEGLNADEFAELQLVPYGTGRLQAFVVTEGGVQLMPDAALSEQGLFWDSELESVCILLPFEDGVSRCVPTQSDYVSSGDPRYNDAACTEPMVVCNLVNDCAGESYVVSTLPQDSCPTERIATAVWSADQPGSGTYSTESGSCQEFALSGAEPWTAQDVDLDTLAVAQISVGE